MKKIYVFAFLCMILCIKMEAQDIGKTIRSDTLPVPAKPKGNSHLASIDLAVPVAVFARSHIAGAGLNYSWSRKRYGRNVTPSRLIGFTFTAGADYYLGKKISPAGYSFRYGGYLHLHAFAGVMVNACPNGNIVLAAGPAAGIYKGSSDMGIGASLFGNYFLDKNISIGPGITYKKYAQTDALWAGVFRVSYSF